MSSFLIYFLWDRFVAGVHGHTCIQAFSQAQLLANSHTYAFLGICGCLLLLFKRKIHFSQVMKVLTFDMTTIIIVIIHIVLTKVPKFESFCYLIIVVEFVNSSVCCRWLFWCSDQSQQGIWICNVPSTLRTLIMSVVWYQGYCEMNRGMVMKNT